MHHIYLYTPIQNNSQFYAHLTEHCAGYAENERAFFVFGNNVIGTSTYYTYFVFDKISKENLNYFIDKICTPVKKEVIKYEYKVIKKELKEYDFNLDLIDKIGKKLYSKSFNYNKTLKLDYETLENYHGKYYKKNNIIILEEDTIYSDKMLNVDKFNIKKFFEINIKNDIEFAYIFDHSIENLFIINLLSDLFDDFIFYILRYKKMAYNRMDTIFGDFEDYIYLSINKKIINLVKKIDKKFIDEYIKNSLAKKGYLKINDFDGPCMIKYGWTLSNNNKKFLLTNLQKYCFNFISSI